MTGCTGQAHDPCADTKRTHPLPTILSPFRQLPTRSTQDSVKQDSGPADDFFTLVSFKICT